jgi:radical SAM superfamily enzyme YgiQ (UPF0313 family)
MVNLPTLDAPSTSGSPAGDGFAQALSRRLQGFDFEGGVVLIQVPQVPLDLIEEDVANSRGYFAYPPQSLLYLSSAFRELGLQTRVLDLNYVVLDAIKRGHAAVLPAWKSALDEALATFENPLVCVSLMFDNTFAEFERVCRHVRERLPRAAVFVGGVAATADPQKILDADLADIVFCHEGEASVGGFYAWLRGTSSVAPMNIVFRDAGGGLREGHMHAGGAVDFDIRDELGKIPIGDYCRQGSLSNFSRMNGLDVPFATILSRRGCRARCSFCGVRNFNGKSVRVRDNEGVLKEMEALHDRHGIRHFDWLDDDLLYDRESIVELFNMIADRLPDVTWAANNGLIASAVKPEILEAMERSHCIGYKIGLESGNPEVLRAIHKPANLESFFTFARLAQNYPSMLVAVNFIMGFPGERFHQMLDSFRVSVHARLDWQNFYVYQHLKNTELYKAIGGASGGLVETEQGKDGQHVSFNPVRAGVFKAETNRLVEGYEIFELDRALEPTREQLREIWFTFNTVANFLKMPALDTDSEVRLKQGVRWMQALQHAYPEDALMGSTLYALQARLGELDTRSLAALKDAAATKLRESPYWQRRDRVFSFSAFLEGARPDIDRRAKAELERS